MKKRFLASLIVTGAVILFGGVANAQPPTGAGSVDANSTCDGHFLTFPAWYNGVVKSGQDGCEVMSPGSVNGGFRGFIWRIALNIIEMMLNLVGYLSVAFIIYGGYKYMYSAGSPDGMVAARKTILNAVIGLIISILSVAIVNTIAGGL